MTTSAFLQAALDAFGPDGERWGQKSSDGFLGCDIDCVHLAIHRVTDEPQFEPTLAAIARVLGVADDDIDAIWDWNDAPARTFADVKALFQAAIAIAQEQESVCV